MFYVTLPWRGGSPAQRAGWGDALSPAAVLQEFDFGFTRTVQLHINPLKHGAQIAGDLLIPEAHDTMALLFEPCLPVAISLGGIIVVVMAAIEFKDEAFGRTEKVDNVRTDGGLAPEMCAV